MFWRARFNKFRESSASLGRPRPKRPSLAAIVPRRSREHADLFHLPPARALRLAPDPCARLLRADEYRQLDNLPPILRGELRDACHYSPIASAFVEDRPVSFCYSGWETETHWDVSIDTLEELSPAWARRRRRAICLHPPLREGGKDGGVGMLSNPTRNQRALARKLGFTPVDRLDGGLSGRCAHGRRW